MVILNLKLCRLIMSSKILAFLLGALQFLSQIGCLALKSPISRNRISLCFLAQGQVYITFQSHLVECIHCPLESVFHLFQLGFQIASKLGCILLTKTILIFFDMIFGYSKSQFFLSES